MKVYVQLLCQVILITLATWGLVSSIEEPRTVRIDNEVMIVVEDHGSWIRVKRDPNNSRPHSAGTIISGLVSQ